MAKLTQRDEHAQQFIGQAGWTSVTRQIVAGDASNRRYDRLTAANGATAILMDAPPDKGEDVRPFIKIAQFLANAGFSSPLILAQDTHAGFLLLEDLGDALFARILERDPLQEMTLYACATDVVCAISNVAPPDLLRLDAATATDATDLVFDWYLGDALAPAKHDFQAAFCPLLAPLDAAEPALIQRDFHAENLLWLPDRTGVARAGLLDFQDAMLGHPAYDMVSFLQDARRDVAPEVVAAMKARFCQQSATDPAAFDAAYALLGTQRNLRILGIFARLCLRDGKAQYVDLIPRVWTHVRTNLAHPALSPVRDLITQTLPEPTPEFLARMRAKCAAHPTP